MAEFGRRVAGSEARSDCLFKNAPFLDVSKVLPYCLFVTLDPLVRKKDPSFFSLSLFHSRSVVFFACCCFIFIHTN